MLLKYFLLLYNNEKNDLDYFLSYIHMLWEFILIPYYQVEAIYIRAHNIQNTRY